MKKQLFSLVMMLAIVVLASTSAMAQPANSSVHPAIHLAGSTHPVSVNRGVGSSTLSWVLYSGTAAGTTANAAHTTTTWPQTSNAFSLVWTDQAAGAYYLEVTETDDDPTCSTTKRGFHIFIIGFDAYVFTSSATGAPIATTALTDCSTSPAYPAFMNDLTINPNNTPRTDGAESGTADGDLSDFVGTNPKTQRDYTVRIVFDVNPETGAAYVPTTALGSIKFDLAIDNTNLVSVNSVANTAATVADVTVPLRASNEFTFPVIYNDRWGANLNSHATVTNVKIYTSADGTGTTLGEEPVSKEDTDRSNATALDNQSDTFIIVSSPNTSTITVN
jgi:hypothetical protein